MGCILVLFAFLLPRLTLFCLWLFGDYLQRAFSGAVFWPLMGFFFAPYTTLAWAYANLNGGFGALNTVIMVIAVLMDLSSHGESGRRLRGRGAGATS
jgi:hypothetical protein